MLARRLGYPANSPDIGVRNMIQRIKEFQRILKIPTTLGDAGVTKSQYEKVKDFIIESALNDACTATNPRKASPKDVEGILEKSQNSKVVQPKKSVSLRLRIFCLFYIKFKIIACQLPAHGI